MALNSGSRCSIYSITPSSPIRTAHRMARVEETMTRRRPRLSAAAIGTPDVVAGNPLVGSGAARDVQVGLKLTF